MYKIMFLVAFGENRGEPVCQLNDVLRRTSVNMLEQTCGYMETKKTFKVTPLF